MLGSQMQAVAPGTLRVMDNHDEGDLSLETHLGSTEGDFCTSFLTVTTSSLRFFFFFLTLKSSLPGNFPSRKGHSVGHL